MAIPNMNVTIPEDHLQIIGVEFTAESPTHGRQELGMWSPSGLIIPRLISAGKHERYEPSITFHTTVGDYTLSQQAFNYGYYLCPW